MKQFLVGSSDDINNLVPEGFIFVSKNNILFSSYIGFNISSDLKSKYWFSKTRKSELLGSLNLNIFN
jgi:hypothetical protein